MPRTWLIIDGYNLLHAAGLIRPRMANGQLERARQKLIGRLVQSLSEAALQDTVIVFDGQGQQGSDSVQERELPGGQRGPEIRFSSAGSDADTEIEQLLAKHSSPAQVIVVSGDHRLHRAAARRKASCVDSDRFLDSLDAEAPRRRETDVLRRAGAKPAAPQLDDSLREELEAQFLSIDPTQLAAEDRELSRQSRNRGLHKKKRP